MEWISVKDGLPDHLERVLMYGRRTKYNDMEIITGILNKAGGLNEWNTYGIIMHNVTHWMPLPNPPKQ